MAKKYLTLAVVALLMMFGMGAAAQTPDGTPVPMVNMSMGFCSLECAAGAIPITDAQTLSQVGGVDLSAGTGGLPDLGSGLLPELGISENIVLIQNIPSSGTGASMDGFIPMPSGGIEPSITFASPSSVNQASVGAIVGTAAAIAGSAVGATGFFTAVRTAWYIYGTQIVTALACGDVCNGMGTGNAALSEEAEVGIQFAQKGVSSTFRHGEFAGKTIVEVAEGLRNGTISAGQLPINVVVRSGVAYTLNNRSLMALRLGGMAPTLVNDVTGNAFFERQLTLRLSELGASAGANFSPTIRGVVDND